MHLCLVDSQEIRYQMYEIYNAEAQQVAAGCIAKVVYINDVFNLYLLNRFCRRAFYCLLCAIL